MKSFKIDKKEFKLYKNDITDNFICGKKISLDTETTGLSLVRDRLCLIQIGDENNNCHLVKFDRNFLKNKAVPKNLIRLLSNDNIEKIFHFARFDLAFIKKFLGVECRNVFCTKIASKLVRTYTDRHGLKDLCREMLNIDLNKSQQTSDWSSDELLPSQIKYAASDVLHLINLKEKLTQMLIREDRLELAENIFKFLNFRVQLDLLGWDQIDIFSHSS